MPAVGGTGSPTAKEQDWIAIHALLTAAAARGLHDPARAEEVATLADRVAEAMHLDAGQARCVDELVALHDVGLIGMPDNLLRKPGPLDEDERAQLAEHPRIGSAIVGSLQTLASIAPLVAAEHERWDGRGYPAGLAGEEIPLPCRIVLACDAYCAMLRPRPDRPALGHDVAVQVLQRNAGSQFCPATVEALLAVLSADGNRIPAPPPIPAVTPAPSLPVAPPERPPPIPVASKTPVYTRPPRTDRLSWQALVAGQLVGLAIGIWWVFPVPSVSRLCPPPGEGADWCALQKAWLPAIVKILGVMVAMVIVTWVLVIAIPRSRERRAHDNAWPDGGDPLPAALSWTVCRMGPARGPR